MAGFINKIWQKVYCMYGVRNNVTIGKGMHIGLGTLLWAPNRLDIGNDVYIGKRCTIECDGSIGDNAIIANDVGLVGRYDHDYSVVGRPVRRSRWIGNQEYNGKGKGLKIILEDDVWVGFGAIILSGVRIGRGAIIGAGSVVTHDVMPYIIVAGNPAHRVANRFTADQIREHELSIYGKVITPLS